MFFLLTLIKSIQMITRCVWQSSLKKREAPSQARVTLCNILTPYQGCSSLLSQLKRKNQYNIMKSIIQKLWLLVAMLCAAIQSSAYDFEVDNNLFFEIISTADLTCKLDSVNEGYEGELVIPEYVEFKGKNLLVISIESNCIRSCTQLTNLTVPATVTEMGDECFSYCMSIQTVNLQAIDASVLPKGCFKYSSVQSIIWPSGIVEIPDECFMGCKNLSVIDIPETIVSIGVQCFAQAVMEAINLPEGVININGSAFEGASVPTLQIPSTVEQLGSWVFSESNIIHIDFSYSSKIKVFPWKLFYYSKIESIQFPPILESIGNGCFEGCRKIRQLNLPNTIKSLDNYCLSGLSLDTLTLSENIDEVKSGCFNNTSVSKLIWLSQNINIQKINDNNKIYYEFSDIKECEIGSNCDFLYLGLNVWNREDINFLFAKSSMQKLTLLDSPNALTIASAYAIYLDRTPSFYIGSYPKNAEGYTSFLTTWMESLSELYIGREINGNPIYAPNLERLTIGNVERVDIEGCPLSKLKFIECVSATPPMINESHFSTDQYINLLVVVPDDAVESYSSADVWKNFWNIIPKSEYEASASVKELVSTSKTELERYDLYGNHVTRDYHGIVIIRYTDGSIVKAMQR